MIKLVNLINYVNDFFNKGAARSIRAKKNIVLSFIFKGISIFVSLLLIPIALNYLDPTRYGIWLTISSLTGWIIFLDIGLGHGLRNKFAEAIAKGDKESARIYVSTTYAIITIIITVFFIIFIGITPFLNWQRILNIPAAMSNEINPLVIIVFGFFSLHFVFKLITILLVADQRPAMRDLINLAGSVITLIIIYTLSKTTTGSLMYLGLSYSAVPAIILLFATVFFFRRIYNEYKPSIKYVDFKYAKQLMSLGSSFFIIQMSMAILFATDNIIISQLFNPSYVTPYQIANKYFSIIIIIFYLVSTPLWSAITEAYSKNDIAWIKDAIRKMIYVWFVFIGITLVMLMASGWVYQIWIGDKVNIPFSLSVAMALFMIISTWNNIFMSFINGVSKIKLQMYSAVLRLLIKIPLSIYFAKSLGFGISGVIAATLFCQLIVSVLSPIQYYKIINNKAYGIWND